MSITSVARYVPFVLLLGAVLPHKRQQAPALPEWAERFLASEPRNAKFGHAWLLRAANAHRVQLAAERRAASAGLPAPPPGMYSLKGTFAMPVLAATYSDVTPAFAPAAYAQTFFGATGSGGSYTLAQFYAEASGGAFTFSGAVTPWITLAKPSSYYNDPSLGVRGRFVEYMTDVLAVADATVDWRLYDNDGPDNIPNSGDDDGYVDMVTFLHPLADGVCSTGAIAGPVATGFQFHLLTGTGSAFITRVIGKNGQPIKIDDFVLSAGLNCNGTGIATMNINVHEMGHALGLPDLNDLDRSSYGVGVWDVMGYGLYAADGRPAQFGAWSRRQLGWGVLTNVTSNGPLTLPPAATSRAAYRIDIPGVPEYFLLENRQRVGADASLPGTGLVLWHVDDAILQPALGFYGGTENESRPGLAVLQADGRRDLALRTTPGDAGDPFPGSSAVHVVSDATTPSLRSSGGATSGIALRGITESAGIVTLDAVVPVIEPLVVAVQSLAGTLGQQNVALTLTARGGVAPYTWSAVDALPANTTLSAGGIFIISPTQLGTFTFRVAVVDGQMKRAEARITLAVQMPAITSAQALAFVANADPVPVDLARALDIAGNHNGRLDVGDVLLQVSRVDGVNGIGVAAGLARRMP